MATLRGELFKFLASVQPATFKIGVFIRDRIRERTLTGGRRFSAPDYVDQRHIRRRRKRGRQTGFVDLNFTGHMLGSMEVRNLRDSPSFDPRGVGSKIRGEGGRFIAAEDVQIGIGWPGSEQAGFTRDNPGYIAYIHTRGYYGPQTKGRYPRDFMALDELIVQEAMSEFGTSLYRMKDTKQEIHVGRV